MNGINDAILRVNLSTGEIGVDHPGTGFFRSTFGGWGLIAHELLAAKAYEDDPLKPANPLIFAPGVVTGASVPGSGRHAVGARSPLTGGFGEADVGGFWGAELKWAGYDGAVITGRAESPVYLWIHDGEAEIRDASQIWGRKTADVEASIRQELGDERIRVAQCGIAGENLVRFACVMHDVNRAAGRCGLGAVMGSKNLKAVAVRGTNRLPAADPDKLARVMGNVNGLMERFAGFREHGTSGSIASLHEAGRLPTHNFRDATFESADRISGQRMTEEYLVGRDTCHACPIACKRKVQVDGELAVEPVYGGPEYESIAALGSICEVDDLEAILYANQLCNAYGLDTISAGVTIAWAMECFERGLLSTEDTGGLKIRFGDARMMVDLVEKIAHKEGFGAQLAEGSLRAAQSIGRGTEPFAVQVKGQEVPMHDPRGKFALGVGYATSPTGADHMHNIHDTGFENDAVMEQMAMLGVQERALAFNDLGPKKVRLAAYEIPWKVFQNCLGICMFVPHGREQTIETVNAVTGWNTNLFEAMKAGERALAMARLFNARAGFTAADDRQPPRFAEPLGSGPHEGSYVPEELMDEAVALYYQMLGWDRETGVPTTAKLYELGLDWLVETTTA